MRTPRIRFTVRLYMAVVAAVTVVMVLGVQATRLVRLREDYLESAALHREHEQIVQEKLSELAEIRSEVIEDDTQVPIAQKHAIMEELAIVVADIRGEVVGDRRKDRIVHAPIADRHAITEEIIAIENQAQSMLKWHVDMKRKWRRAADRPWETVSRDSHPCMDK